MNIKDNALFALKVIVTLAVTSLVLSAVGVNLFALISSPVSTLKNLVTPAPKA